MPAAFTESFSNQNNWLSPRITKNSDFKVVEAVSNKMIRSTPSSACEAASGKNAHESGVNGLHGKKINLIKHEISLAKNLAPAGTREAPAAKEGKLYSLKVPPMKIES